MQTPKCLDIKCDNALKLNQASNGTSLFVLSLAQWHFSVFIFSENTTPLLSTPVNYKMRYICDSVRHMM